MLYLNLILCNKLQPFLLLLLQTLSQLRSPLCMGLENRRRTRLITREGLLQHEAKKPRVCRGLPVPQGSPSRSLPPHCPPSKPGCSQENGHQDRHLRGNVRQLPLSDALKIIGFTGTKSTHAFLKVHILRTHH